jgi:hypothetical protein
MPQVYGAAEVVVANDGCSAQGYIGEMLGSPIALRLEAPLALLVQLLEWVEARPRTYAETMEAWRASRPSVPLALTPDEAILPR